MSIIGLAAARELLGVKTLAPFVWTTLMEQGPNLRYHELHWVAAQATYRRVIEEIQMRQKVAYSVSASSSDTARKEVWEKCWGAVDEKVDTVGFDAQGLLPPHLCTPIGTPVRLEGRYVLPGTEWFEVIVLRLIEVQLFEDYFKDCGSVAEFGCGSGHNLLALDRQQPGKRLYGFDWSQAAVDTVNQLRARFGISVVGERFDFFYPTGNKDLEGAGVLTVGALEQVGDRFGMFLEWLIAQKPRVVVHIEPIEELYGATPFDFLAQQYHHARGYLTGFLPTLQEHPRVELLRVHRVPFGSLFHEAYTEIVWRPRYG